MNLICFLKGHKFKTEKPNGMNYRISCQRCSHFENKSLVGKSVLKKEKKQNNFDEFLKKLWSKE